MTGYEAFTIYHVLKLHFTTSYDYFKYNGKSNITIDSFEKRRDKYHFYKLSRKFDIPEYCSFVISNLMINDNCWAGSLLEEDAIVNHMNRKNVIQSLSYNFKNDCERIREEGTLNDVLATTGEYPILLTMTLQKVTQVETLCILDSLVGFLKIWNKKIDDDIRWPTLHKKWTKYAPFLEFDKAQYKKTAMEIFK